ncbi:MAG: AAA-associated domain-containing protein [Candidatus Heimdallarchaeota archaeon]
MRIGKTNAKAIIECVKTIDLLSIDSEIQVTSEKVHEYLRMSFEYVNDAIEAAILLQFINNDDILTLSSIGQKLIGSTTNQSQILFKDQLQKMQPVIQLIELISEGNNIEDAVKKIIVSYNIQGAETEIYYSFRNLLTFANLLGLEDDAKKE